MRVKRSLIVLVCILTLIVSSIYATGVEQYFISVFLIIAASLVDIHVISKSDSKHEDNVCDKRTRNLVKLHDLTKRKQTSHRTYHR